MGRPTAGDVLRDNLLRVATAYAEATGRALATVSRRFHGNHAFLANYRDRRCSPTTEKYDDMMGRLSAEWPVGLLWPPMDRTPAGRPAKKVDVENSRGL